MKTTNNFIATLVATMALGIAGVAHAASTLLINGRIYTSNPAAPWAGGIAIDGARIEAVGSSADIEKLRGPDTRVIDLRGRTVIPGIIDSHAHVLLGSMAVHGINLSTPEWSIWPDQPEELVNALREYARANPGEKIIFARGNFDPQGSPDRRLLDRAVPDRPLVMHNVSEHSMWINSKALELAGITARPAANAIEDAGIVRNPDGSPTGVIRELSMEIVERAVLATLSTEEKLAMLRQGIRALNQLGITTAVNATGDLSQIELYATLRDRGELTIRTRNSFGAVAMPHRLTPQFLNDLELARKRYNDDWVSANLVKFFTDGASGPWPPIYKPEEFRDLVIELDRRGYQIMTHALQAKSANMVLDAYEELNARNGKRDRRLRVEHADRLQPGDIQRFAKLGIVASMQPSFCCHPEIPGAAVPADPWRTLLDAGVSVVFSSDWPCTWPADPFIGIQQAVTRWVWDGRAYGGAQSGRVRTGAVNAPQERITAAEALDAYTRAGAHAAFMENKIGTLEVGKLADLVVLTQNVLTVPAEEISRTRVTMTMVGGKIVYGAVP